MLIWNIQSPHKDNLSSCGRYKIITSTALGTMHAQHFLIAEREQSIYDSCRFDIGPFRAEPSNYERCLHTSDTYAYRSAHNNLFLTLRVIHKLKNGQVHLREPNENTWGKDPKKNKAWIKPFWIHFTYFGRLLGIIYLFLIPSKTDGRVSSCSKVHRQPATWLTGKFSSRRMSRQVIGQNLAIQWENGGDSIG